MRLAFLDQKRWVTVQGTVWKEVLVREKTSGKMVCHKVPYTEATHYPPGSVRAFDTSGKRVGPKALAQLLKNPSKVLVSADGNKVHPFHLRGAKKGALILVFPKSKARKSAAPMPTKADRLSMVTVGFHDFVVSCPGN
jgi:hypothetical protein